MRRALIITLSAAAFLAPAVIAVSQPGRPQRPAPPRTEHPISAEPERLKLGWLRPEEKGEGTVKLVNTSDEVINIVRVTSSCTCTVGKLEDDQKILKPGESTELTVSLKAGKNTGPMAQRAYVYYEGARAPYELFVLADVSLPVKTDPTFVNLMGSNRTGTIRLESLDGTPFRVTSVDGDTPTVYDLAGAEVDPEEPREAVLVEYDYEGIAEEDLDRWFVVETDHPEARELPIRVLHPSLYQVQNSRATWSVATDRLVLGRLRAGDATSRQVRVRALPSPDDITSIEVMDDRLDAEIIGNRVDGRDIYLTVRVKATGAGTGLVKTKLKLTAKDETHDVDIIARVESPS